MKKLLTLLLATVLLFGAFALAEETWICPECENEASGNFCSNCGTARPEDENAEWTCSKCGKTATGKFCSNCGTARGAAAEAETAAVDPTSLESVLNYLLAPVSNGAVVADIIMEDDDDFSVRLDNGDTFYGELERDDDDDDDGEYSIELTQLTSVSISPVNDAYDIESEEFLSVLNFLLGGRGRTIEKVIPMFGNLLVTAQDNKGASYTLTLYCTGSMVLLSLTRDK